MFCRARSRLLFLPQERHNISSPPAPVFTLSPRILPLMHFPGFPVSNNSVRSVVNTSNQMHSAKTSIYFRWSNAMLSSPMMKPRNKLKFSIFQITFASAFGHSPIKSERKRYKFWRHSRFYTRNRSLDVGR